MISTKRTSNSLICVCTNRPLLKMMFKEGSVKLCTFFSGSFFYELAHNLYQNMDFHVLKHKLCNPPPLPPSAPNVGTRLAKY